MITLGSLDHTLSADSPEVKSYMTMVQTFIHIGDTLKGPVGPAPFKAIPQNERMSVSEVQQVLQDAGFFPGSTISGICGYRTFSAIRLFQEYVRTVEGRPEIGVPDGLFGNNTANHLERWRDNNLKADWVDTFEAWDAGRLPSSEYTSWLSFLNKVKDHYLDHPTLMLKKVNAFSGNTDTLKVEKWDFDPTHVHMIGIRRGETMEKHNFNDILLLLIKGLVFKFQGSTDPGSTSHSLGAPFLAQGQHDYHFGWHQGKYQALRPLHHGSHGVLVARSKGDLALTDDDINRGLTANGTINIHWGGRGVARNVNKWSEGCQVIAGSGYINHNEDLVECNKANGTTFVAINNGAVTHSNTRGAYDVLADVVTALSGDMQSSVVKYMLLLESDLAMSPEIASFVATARDKASVLIDKS